MSDMTDGRKVLSIAVWPLSRTSDPDGSPSEEICDCIQYVDTRTATSILRRALAAGVRFRAAEVAEIADSGQIEMKKHWKSCSDSCGVIQGDSWIRC